ncbi:MAG: T9SS type A sorting domain-containing protein [Elusimicrobia bacterium]|nr:T9SS type A sorting domain-containing protein [Elusimicrobiota bacterium]
MRNNRLIQRWLTGTGLILAFSGSAVSGGAGLPSQSLRTLYDQTALVQDAQGNPLPTEWELFPTTGGTVQWGGVNLSSGGTTTPRPIHVTYAGGRAVPMSGLVMVPPPSATNFTKLFFHPVLDPATTWELEVTMGLLDTGTTGRVHVQVVVGGDRPNALDDPWAVLVSTTMAAGDTRVLKVPLGLWPLRNHFVLALQTSKTPSNTQPDLVVLEDATLVPGPARPEMGIARSNINWSPDPAKVINGIAGLNPGWLRNTTGPGTPPVRVAAELAQAKARGLKVLLAILPERADFNDNYLRTLNPNVYEYENAGTAFNSLCGYTQGSPKLSEVDPVKFANRLAAFLQAAETAGVHFDAVEIGNELDWVCFNGDIPLGQIPGPLDSSIRTYGKLLEKAYPLVKNHNPSASIVTFGMANAGTFQESTYVTDPGPNYVADPGRNFILRLATIDAGKNYLDFVDGIGTHLYPGVGRSDRMAKMVLGTARSLGVTKPYWVTEWGFRSDLYPASSRYQDIRKTIEGLNSMGSVPVRTLLYYSYDDLTPGHPHNLVDASGARLPEAGMFEDPGLNPYPRPAPPTPVDATPPAVNGMWPGAGSAIAGRVLLKANPTDNVRPNWVTFTVDGQPAWSMPAIATTTYSWNSASATDGLHTVGAIVYDVFGNSVSTAVTVMVDNGVPAVSILQPSPGASVWGSVVVSAAPTDAMGVGSVVFLVNGVAKATATAAPYEYAWPTSAVVNGPAVLTARVYDRAGNSALSLPVAVTVANRVPALAVTPLTVDFAGSLGDTNPSPKSLSIGNSVAGSTLVWTVTGSIPWLTVFPSSGTGSGTVSLSANLSGQGLGLQTGTLTVTALDINGAAGSPAMVNVNLVISPSLDTTPPLVSFTAPTPGARVTGTVFVAISATDDRGVQGVVFFVDGVSVSTDTAPPFAYAWDTTRSSPGVHSVLVQAYDAAGNRTQETLRVSIPPQEKPTAYPNPYRGEGTMRFSGLEGGSRIKIFTSGGRLVAELPVDSDGQSAWEGQNAGGLPAASGVYLVAAESGKARRTFKILIQR